MEFNDLRTYTSEVKAEGGRTVAVLSERSVAMINNFSHWHCKISLVLLETHGSSKMMQQQQQFVIFFHPDQKLISRRGKMKWAARTDILKLKICGNNI